MCRIRASYGCTHAEPSADSGFRLAANCPPGAPPGRGQTQTGHVGSCRGPAGGICCPAGRWRPDPDWRGAGHPPGRSRMGKGHLGSRGYRRRGMAHSTWLAFHAERDYTPLHRVWQTRNMKNRRRPTLRQNLPRRQKFGRRKCRNRRELLISQGTNERIHAQAHSRRRVYT